MGVRRKAKFKVGQVVFAKEDGEYIRVIRIGPTQDLGMQQIRCFNSRWGGDEVHQAKHLRPLTARERGSSNGR
jgi:hypothetical protein